MACAFSLLFGAGIFLPVRFSLAADLTWTGATSGDWGVGTNWSTGAVPTASDNVTIPDAGTTNNDPSVGAGAICNSLAIASGGILNGNAQTITVAGSWTNNGSFNHGGGKVKFGGTAGIITFTPGTSAYYDLEVNRTNNAGDNDGVNVSGTAIVEGDFTQTDGSMANGQIDLAGDYIIGAASNGATYGGNATAINLNHASNDQAIVYNAGGIGATVRVDKAGGTLTISNDLVVAGWIHVQGTVAGLDTHKLSFADIGLSLFTPGSISYSDVEVNKPNDYSYYGTLNVSGTATVTGNFIQTDGDLSGGQIDLAGNYVIGALASGSAPSGSASTIINLNHASNDQAIVYNAGGIGATVRVDKAGGTVTVSADINVNGWVYVRGVINGLSAHTLILGDDYYGVFAPGSITYGNIEINKTRNYINWDQLTVSAATLNINGNLTLTDGQLNFSANNPTVNVSGNVSIAVAGTLYAGTNPITVNGNWTNAGTFNHGNGKIILAGSSGPATFTPGTSSYYGLEENKTNDYGNNDDVYVSGTATVLGDFTQTDGEIGHGQINLVGNYVIGANSGGAPNGEAPTVINFNGSNNQSIAFSSGGVGTQIRVDKAAGTLGISSNIVIMGWTYVQGAVAGLDSHRLVFGDYGAGSFTPGAFSYTDLEVNKGTTNNSNDTLNILGTATVTGNFIQTSGQIVGGQINLAGDYVLGASSGGTANDYVYTATVINFNHSSNDQSIVTSGGWGAHVTINKAGGNLTISTDVKLSGWTYVQGTVVGISNHTLTLGDNFYDTFVFGGLTYGNVEINKNFHYGSWDQLISSSGTLNISGNLTVTEGHFVLSDNNTTLNVTGNIIVAAAGTLSAGTNPVTVNGNWTNAGTFNHGNGRLVFVGTANTSFAPGASSYYDLELNKAATNDNLTISAAANILNDFIHTNGEIRENQLNVSGDYVIGALADGSVMGYGVVATNINLCGTGNQAIVYGGGTGGRVRIDKTSGTLSVTDNLIVNGWIYVQGVVTGMDSHLLVIGDDYSGYFTPGALTYQGVEIRKMLDFYNGVTISGTGTVTGDFILTNGQTSGGQINLGGDYVIGAAADGQIGGYGATATVINLNHASADQHILYSAGGIGQTVRVDKAGGSLIVSDDLTVSGWEHVTGSVTGLDNHVLSLADDSSGYFTPGAMTYGDIVINRYGAYYYSFAMRSGTLDIDGDLSLLDGDIRFNSGNPAVQLAGDLTVGANATLYKGTGILTFDGPNSAIFTDLSAMPQNVGKVVINKSNADAAQNLLTLASSMTADTLGVSAGNALALGAGGHVLTLASAGTTADVFTINGALDGGDGTVRYAATNSVGNINLAPAAYHALELAGAETYVLTADTAIAGNLTIGASSILDTATYDLTLSGNLDNAGTFVAGSNVVSLAGNDQALSGNTIFYDLTKTISIADTLAFAAGSTTAVGHGLTLRGASREQRLTLQSSVPGSVWNLTVDPLAIYDFDSLAVSDSVASRNLTSLNSLDSGHNLNWTLVNNTAPALTVPTVSSDRGVIAIAATVSDTDADNLNLKVEYSLDGGASWLDPFLTAATATTGTPSLDNVAVYQLTAIPTAASNTLAISWDTASTLNQAGRIEYATQLRVRLTPFDGTDYGTVQTSALFTVDNRPSSFIVPAKPDLSGLEITTAEGRLNFDNLPASVIQIAVSSSPDFANASFEDISSVDLSLHAADPIYLKFRTQRGGVSDVMAYGRVSGVATTLLAEGDIAKTLDSPDVFIVKYKNGKQFKRLILSPSVFASYGHLKWDQLKVVSQSQLDSYQTSTLVQVAEDPALYELTPLGDTGRRRALAPSETYDPDSVYEINAVDRDSYLVR